MHLKKYRLQSPNDDLPESGTGVVDETELEPDDQGDALELEQEPPETGAEEGAEAEEELVVTLGGEPQEEEEQAPNWVKDLRRKNREDQKRIRELEAKLAGQSGSQQGGLKEPEYPELEQFDYDADLHKEAVKKYTREKLMYDREIERQRAIQEEANKEWEKVVNSYKTGKARFDADKMQEAEEEVVSVLSPARQAMLMDAADDSAALTLALGSNPETLRKVASIKSDAKFIAELVKVQMKMTVQSKKTPPPPERTIGGAGKTPGATANNLAALKKKAEDSGDYAAYFAEKRRLGK